MQIDYDVLKVLNEDSGEVKVQAGSQVDSKEIKKGQSYTIKDNLWYGRLEDVAWEKDQQQRLRDLGFVNADNEVIFPAGTKLTYKGYKGGAEVFDIAGEEFDLSLDDVNLYNVIDSNVRRGYNADFAKELIDKFGKESYKKLIDLANITDDIELAPERFIKDAKNHTSIPSSYLDKFVLMYSWQDAKQWQKIMNGANESESAVLNMVEKICRDKGFEYTPYSDSISIEGLDFKNGYGTKIDEVTIYADGSIDIRNAGPISLIPKDFDLILDVFTKIRQKL